MAINSKARANSSESASGTTGRLQVHHESASEISRAALRVTWIGSGRINAGDATRRAFIATRGLAAVRLTNGFEQRGFHLRGHFERFVVPAREHGHHYALDKDGAIEDDLSAHYSSRSNLH